MMVLNSSICIKNAIFPFYTVLCKSNKPHPKAIISRSSFLYKLPFSAEVVQFSLTDNDFVNCLAAVMNFVPLSSIIFFGNYFLLANLRNANINVSSDKCITTSKCTARVLAKVNRQI